jgi:XTP/dITP diphosphohydrolase
MLIQRSRLVIATANSGKFEEISSDLADQFSEFYCLNDFREKIEVIEDGSSYYENALKKARKVGDRLGIDTLADDSGLEVAALGGRPGPFSSRYGTNDQDRIARLLRELRGVRGKGRSAVFKAYLAYYRPDSARACLFYGSLTGYIGSRLKGNNGFGYDPIFYLSDSNTALAELAREEKNMISHRGRALQAFRRFLSG